MAGWILRERAGLGFGAEVAGSGEEEEICERWEEWLTEKVRDKDMFLDRKSVV